MDGNTITREELYEEVWSTPVSRLAPRYNLSDVGFAKLCRRSNIPLPPRGYWAKLEAGQKIQRTPLPTIAEEGEIRVHVPDPAEVAMKEKARMEVEAREAQLPKIEVAETLRGCHQLVSTSNDAFQGARERDDGSLHSPDGSPLSLLVSCEQLRRSLLVMSALLKAFESLGHKVSAGPKIEINGQSVTLAIREATVKVEEEFDASNKRLRAVMISSASENERSKFRAAC
jgi:hypothetical protein